MGLLVIKEWKAATKPIDEKNNYIKIIGRERGFWAWLLSKLKIDPTVSMYVSPSWVEFSMSSFFGTYKKYVNIDSISSTYYGYSKPWLKSLLIFFLNIVFLGGIGNEFFKEHLFIVMLVSVVFSIFLSIFYYQYHKVFILGFTENSGQKNEISFKRSYIEDVEISEEQAKFVCYIIQKLLEFKQKKINQ